MGVIKRVKKRVQARRDEASEKRRDKFAFGGSKAEEKEIIDEQREAIREGRGEVGRAREDVEKRQSKVGGREQRYDREYLESRESLKNDIGAQRDNIGEISAGADKAAGILGAGADKASNILGAAAGANRLTGTTENILAQRAQAMAANPSYAQLANDAIAAQTQGVQNQTNFAQGQLARRAMGMAAGSGEGGALNAQQAMASLVGAGGDMAMQANLANQANAAAQRAQAVMAQRGESVGEADYASQSRLGAAGTERATDLSTAAQQAGLQSGASVGQAGLVSGKAIQTQNALQGLTATGQGITNTAASQLQGTQGAANDLTELQTNAGIIGKGQEVAGQTGILTGITNKDIAVDASAPRGMFRGLRGRR